MRLLIADNYRTAKESLRRSKTRTALTILGVTIGVGAITTVLALLSGVSSLINSQVSQLGHSIAVVRPKAPNPTITDLTNPTATTAYTTSPLTERDLASIQHVSSVTKAAPIMTITASIRNGNIRPANTTLVSTTPSFADINKFTFQTGQFIDSVTDNDTAVVGQQLAVELFGTDQAAGKIFTINDRSFTVIGVLAPQNQPVNFNNIDFDNAAIIDLASGKAFNGNLAQIQQIDIATKPHTDMNRLKAALIRTLNTNHDGAQDVAILTGNDIAKPTSRLFVLINGITALVASISLIVGGIGIMNIMLVGVAERTREIGLRKAIGASDGMIIMQFLSESLIISLLGGLFGFVGGYIAAFIISLGLPYNPTFSWQIAIWAFGLSIIVGVIFGLYPAVRAARKDPIESLRQYQ